MAIVNESLARRVFGDTSPLGQRIGCCDEGKFRTVIGVVRNLKSESPESPAGPEIYVPFDQDNQVSARLLVRTQGTRNSLFLRYVARLLPSTHSGRFTTSARWMTFTIRLLLHGGHS